MLFRGHYRLEKHSIALALGIIVVSGIGGFMEIAPLFTIDETVESDPDMRVYTPLELAGRHIYMREGCYACHSQMVRTLTDEVDRYGPYSLAIESQYDHPMLWGSKRTGPDLARVGEKYSDAWQTLHLYDPRRLVPESIMPAYRWLLHTPLDTDDLSGHLSAMRRVGVPYDEDMIAAAADDAVAQATPDDPGAAELVARYGEATNVRPFDGLPDVVTEMDALVAYLQILGGLTDLPYELFEGEAARGDASSAARGTDRPPADGEGAGGARADGAAASGTPAYESARNERAAETVKETLR